MCLPLASHTSRQIWGLLTVPYAFRFEHSLSGHFISKWWRIITVIRFTFLHNRSLTWLPAEYSLLHHNYCFVGSCEACVKALFALWRLCCDDKQPPSRPHIWRSWGASTPPTAAAEGENQWQEALAGPSHWGAQSSRSGMQPIRSGLFWNNTSKHL